MTVLVGESVVFIDDDEEVRRANAQSLELAGFEVQVFAAAETAQSALSPDFPGVVVTDVRLPRMNGLTLLRQLMELDPDLPVILITGHGDIPMAVEAMREGAYDFFEKPYAPDRLIDSVRRAAEKRRLVLENRALRAELAHHEAEDPLLLGRTPAVENLRQTLASIAEIDVDVFDNWRGRLRQAGGGDRNPPLEPAAAGEVRRAELQRYLHRHRRERAVRPGSRQG